VAALLPVLLATVFGAIALWPSGDPVVGTVPITGGTSHFVRAEVTGFPKGGIGDGITGVTARLEQGGKAILVQVPPEQLAARMANGSRIKVMYIPEAAAYGSPYVFVDYVRTIPIAVLAIFYAVLVVAVARWRGLAAMVGLGVALAGIVVFTLPALLAGSNALAVGLVTASGVMFVVLYLAHGFSARTTTALLGTFGGLALTALIGGVAVGAAHLNGISSDDNQLLAQAAGQIDPRGLLTCGIILAGLGVLNDVTITQASAVWELRQAAPGMAPRRLYHTAMRIGRDHIASTIYTIVFAYAGAALPVLLLIELYGQPLANVLTTSNIAEELVRTMASAIGLVLAVPLTTALAVAVATVDRHGPGTSRHGTR